MLPEAAPDVAVSAEASQLLHVKIRTGGLSCVLLMAQIAYCEEKRRLFDDFAEAVRDLVELNNQQVAALIQGDTEFSRFDLLIHAALEKKQRAKYAYILHGETHGC